MKISVYIDSYRNIVPEKIIHVYGVQLSEPVTRLKGIKAIEKKTKEIFIFYYPVNIKYLCWYKL